MSLHLVGVVWRSSWRLGSRGPSTPSPSSSPSRLLQACPNHPLRVNQSQRCTWVFAPPGSQSLSEPRRSTPTRFRPFSRPTISLRNLHKRVQMHRRDSSVNAATKVDAIYHLHSFAGTLITLATNFNGSQSVASYARNRSWFNPGIIECGSGWQSGCNCKERSR
ncbi:hypothetical protein Taro_001798 [Colocasia esculenta]|uniref:Uncharacterized protein n=1 Tax=Colocasia esculenta TaxID=4460 RepID=A0A843TK02_COLES|nr:hypothetical protein [Colocasia esculenta]